MVHGCKAFQVCKKLKALKQPLKGLFKTNYKNITARIEETEKAYNEALSAVQRQPSDAALLEEASSLRSKALLLRKMEHTHLSQLAKCKFLREGDKGSSFFHGFIKRNQKRRFIAAITLDDGSVTHSTEEVDNAFTKYFTDLLGCSPPVRAASLEVCRNGKLVEPADFPMLLQEISSAEI